jgi:hypothetical protein
MTQMHAGSSWSVSGDVRGRLVSGGCQRLRPMGAVGRQRVPGHFSNTAR